MYVYCYNNCINYIDNKGNFPIVIFVGAGVGAAFGALDAYMSNENVWLGAFFGGFAGGAGAAMPATILGSRFIACAANTGLAIGVDLAQQKVNHELSDLKETESFVPETSSLIISGTSAFWGHAVGNQVNRFVDDLLETDDIAEAIYEYFSGLFSGAIDLIKNHGSNNEKK